MLHLYTTASTQIEQMCPQSKGNLSAISVTKERMQVNENPFIFSAQQQSALLKMYERNRYPTMEEKESIANDLGVSSIRVNRWFLGRRHRDRKEWEITKKCKYKIKNQSL